MILNHLNDIVWHLRNGQDNGGLTAEALAAYLEHVDAELMRLSSVEADDEPKPSSEFCELDGMRGLASLAGHDDCMEHLEAEAFHEECCDR